MALTCSYDEGKGLRTFFTHFIPTKKNHLMIVKARVTLAKLQKLFINELSALGKFLKFFILTWHFYVFAS